VTKASWFHPGPNKATGRIEQEYRVFFLVLFSSTKVFSEAVLEILQALGVPPTRNDHVHDRKVWCRIKGAHGNDSWTQHVRYKNKSRRCAKKRLDRNKPWKQRRDKKMRTRTMNSAKRRSFVTKRLLNLHRINNPSLSRMNKPKAKRVTSREDLRFTSPTLQVRVQSKLCESCPIQSVP
jgi:hypothetical protein